MERGNRRAFLGTLGLAAGSAAVGLAALPLLAKEKGGSDGKKTGAVEDLMREHGVLRRALLANGVCAQRLQSGKDAEAAPALLKIAKLFRAFGEDYHERKLEEAHIFPLVRKSQGPAAKYPDILVAQHNRGREITDYIMAVCASGRIAASDARPLAGILEQFIWMYQHHAAREDTLVFQAWKEALSAKALDEMGEEFEEIEKAEFGGDGFEDALKTMEGIEAALGMTDLAQFTSPAPPKH